MHPTLRSSIPVFYLRNPRYVALHSSAITKNWGEYYYASDNLKRSLPAAENRSPHACDLLGDAQIAVHKAIINPNDSLCFSNACSSSRIPLIISDINYVALGSIENSTFAYFPDFAAPDGRIPSELCINRLVSEDSLKHLIEIGHRILGDTQAFSLESFFLFNQNKNKPNWRYLCEIADSPVHVDTYGHICFWGKTEQQKFLDAITDYGVDPYQTAFDNGSPIEGIRVTGISRGEISVEVVPIRSSADLLQGDIFFPALLPIKIGLGTLELTTQNLLVLVILRPLEYLRKYTNLSKITMFLARELSIGRLQHIEENRLNFDLTQDLVSNILYRYYKEPSGQGTYSLARYIAHVLGPDYTDERAIADAFSRVLDSPDILAETVQASKLYGAIAASEASAAAKDRPEYRQFEKLRDKLALLTGDLTSHTHYAASLKIVTQLLNKLIADIEEKVKAYQDSIPRIEDRANKLAEAEAATRSSFEEVSSKCEGLLSSLFEDDNWYENLLNMGVLITGVQWLRQTNSGPHTLYFGPGSNPDINAILTPSFESNYVLSNVNFVTLSPLVLKDASSMQNPDIVAGPFEVSVSFNRHSGDPAMKLRPASMHSIVAVHQNIADILVTRGMFGLRFHPHSRLSEHDSSTPITQFSYRWQDCCLGELSPMLFKARNLNSVKQVVLSALCWLTSYNSEDYWGQSWTYFPRATEVDTILIDFDRESILHALRRKQEAKQTITETGIDIEDSLHQLAQNLQDLGNRN